MGNSSKDLLHLEQKYSSASTTESALLVCNQKSQLKPKNPNPNGKPVFSSVPKSQVLGKVRDFLEVLSEANKRLELDAKDKADEYNIEVLRGNESKVIELDLMLGIADLHTPKAVAAAESAITSNQPVIPFSASSSRTKSEDRSDGSEDDDERNIFFPTKRNRGKTPNDDSGSEAAENKRSKKGSKIIELS